jgi:Fur family transcriptional regulator, ferric uptake regulator
MNTLTQCIDTLRDHGYSITKARKEVFAVLEKSEPLTMHELVRQLPNIDRASVYRVVALFEKLGIVHRLHIGWKYKIELTNNYQPHHHHITCVTCGKSQPFHEDSHLENSLQTTAKSEGFILKNHLIELQGICTDCQ